MTLSPAQSRASRGRLVAGAAASGAALVSAGLLVLSASPVQAAATVVPLGTAGDYSVLAASTVTNTGTTTIAQSIGVHPGSEIANVGTLNVGGETHVADAESLQAQNDLDAAYGNAAGQGPVNNVDPELGGETLVGGVYRGPTLGLTNTLTLDGANDPDSVWVFQSGATLITASDSAIEYVRGANPCNVFWQVASSATLGTRTSFVGTVMANDSIAMQTGATLEGRALALTGAVTLDSNVITQPDCDVPPPTTEPPTTAPPTTTTPTPGGPGGPGGPQVPTAPTGPVATGDHGAQPASDDSPLLLAGALGLAGIAGFAGVAVAAARRRPRG